MTFIPVILAGGKGERFWPLSRQDRPKQFLSLDGSGISLLQATANRLVSQENWPDLWVITAAQVADLVREQLPQLPQRNILVEPERRDTAAAIAWTCLELAKYYPADTVVAFFPADHWIGDPDKFRATLDYAANFVKDKLAIATIGIKPDYPATGYGYIEQGEAVETGIFKVNQFYEKPGTAVAKSFLETGKFSWNSGIFLFSIRTALQELANYAPEILEPLQNQGIDAYNTLPKISIDYALMEKTEHAYVLPAEFGWDDLGDWRSLERLLPPDAVTNVCVGTHHAFETERAIVYSDNPGETVVTLGVSDVVVVRQGDVTLIVDKHRTQDIKKILGYLPKNLL
ncbi:mannose-1-phosphate guanylyltransferase [Picosynechococcus sp. PCC 7003]|uniref:mannose-1-phosphate guanylyltransferase n=1 Tax=Picosynechococcus sp. PCC 7003 TaxID=374981 RepID=UPI000810E9CD|nr:mannose-1-phosphate guanylyltransferase [Picosynechococcus sp. PCC 7003]ANV84665.1 mannose-1-phosphate guanylyltransferase [Picosynechococcus sp. PCC 7003]